MNKKIWIIIGVAALLVLLIGLNIWKLKADSNVKIDVTTLQEKTITETVLTPGQLKLANEQIVYYTAEKGTVKEILVKEGDSVKKGAPLIRYENKQLTLEKKQNELQIKSTNLQVSDLASKRKETEKLLKDDKENEALKAELEQIKLQQQQTQIELEQLQLQKEVIQQQIAELEVKSEVDGKIVEVNEQAALASNQLEQQPVIRIGTLDDLIVEGTISEYDTLKIEKGQAVTLKSDAVPDQAWEGVVSLISDLPKQQEGLEMDGGGVQYPIQVKVEDEIELKPGFQMLIEIKTKEQKANVLPLTAVKQDGEDNYVFVVNENKAERRDVKVGSVSNKMIEIIEGVEADEQIIVDPTDEIKNGTEVTIK
ncbi:efflux RND transporter periplasmic adaptor subunit [Pueribacillus sp. YX66]|uniref:efflux RND transporter periplasmic adaptor subunit n=1 Tax=Pueribacillus sp. YX66 TaxID=3229242 RepID=UPI00358D42D3